MFLRQYADGDWYLCRITSSNRSGDITKRKVGRVGKQSHRNWWLVKEDSCIACKVICLPRKFIGKRVRFKMEVLE